MTQEPPTHYEIVRGFMYMEKSDQTPDPFWQDKERSDYMVDQVPKAMAQVFRECFPAYAANHAKQHVRGWRSAPSFKKLRDDMVYAFDIMQDIYTPVDIEDSKQSKAWTRDPFLWQSQPYIELLQWSIRREWPCSFLTNIYMVVVAELLLAPLDTICADERPMFREAGRFWASQIPFDDLEHGHLQSAYGWGKEIAKAFNLMRAGL